MVDSCPEPALAMLKDIPDVANSRDANRALYNLLLTKAQYKLYLPTSPDTNLAFSQQYFEQKPDKRLLAETYYYRAMTLLERHKTAKAALLLKQGEQLAETLNNDSLISKYYEGLCQINYNAQYWQMMLVYAKKFLEHSLYINNVEYICRALDHVSLAYDRMGQADSSYIYLQKSMSQLSKASKSAQANVLANFGIELRIRGNYDKAKECLSQSINLFPLPHAYCGLGNIYYAEDSLEKADSCWAKAMAMGDAETKTNVQRAIMQLMARHKDYERAYELAMRVNELEDSMQQAAQTQQLAEIEHRYDHQVAVNRYYRWAVAGLAAAMAALVLTVVLIVWHQRQVKSYRAMIADEQQRLGKAQAQIDQMKEDDKKNARKVARLRDKVDEQKQQVVRRMADGKAIYDALAAGQPMPAVPKDADRCLADYIATSQAALFDQWMQQYEGLTPRLITYLAMVSMGRTDDDIMQQLSVSSGAIRTMKSRLKQHFIKQEA